MISKEEKDKKLLWKVISILRTKRIRDKITDALELVEMEEVADEVMAESQTDRKSIYADQAIGDD